MPTADFEGLSLDKVGKIEYLIELLNKSKKAHGIDLSREAFIDNEYDLMKELDKISELQPFVKRLVENDKIDFIKLDDDSNWYDINTESEYLDILALLSIQDNPIEFLISVLR